MLIGGGESGGARSQKGGRHQSVWRSWPPGWRRGEHTADVPGRGDALVLRTPYCLQLAGRGSLGAGGGKLSSFPSPSPQTAPFLARSHRPMHGLCEWPPLLAAGTCPWARPWRGGKVALREEGRSAWGACRSPYFRPTLLHFLSPSLFPLFPRSTARPLDHPTALAPRCRCVGHVSCVRWLSSEASSAGAPAVCCPPAVLLTRRVRAATSSCSRDRAKW